MRPSYFDETYLVFIEVTNVNNSMVYVNEFIKHKKIINNLLLFIDLDHLEWLFYLVVVA